MAMGVGRGAPRRVWHGKASEVRAVLVAALAVVATLVVAAVPAGADPVFCNGVEATIVGTDQADIINGTEGDDVIAALAGDDAVLGFGGNDLMCAGDGKDTVVGGVGDDTIFGEQRADYLYGNDGNDTIVSGRTRPVDYPWDLIDGGAGDDTLTSPVGVGFPTVRPGLGSDTMTLGPSSMVVQVFSGGATWDFAAHTATDGVDTDTWTGTPKSFDGTPWGDTFHLAGEGYWITASAGNDVADGNFDNARVVLGDGADTAVVASGTPFSLGGDDSTADAAHDTLVLRPRSTAFVDTGQVHAFETVYGSAYGDTITQMQGTDVFYGGDGDDSVANVSTVFGGGGDDHIVGNCGPSTLYGGDGNDVIYGSSGACTQTDDADYIRGNAGVDQLFGGIGPDRILGRDGAPGDAVHGGSDADTCNGDGGDTIANCEA
jgi:Ca2+-binding RTX toxin-like protein